jgi:hypothetical protein
MAANACSADTHTTMTLPPSRGSLASTKIAISAQDAFVSRLMNTETGFQLHGARASTAHGMPTRLPHCGATYRPAVSRSDHPPLKRKKTPAIQRVAGVINEGTYATSLKRRIAGDDQRPGK